MTLEAPMTRRDALALTAIINVARAAPTDLPGMQPAMAAAGDLYSRLHAYADRTYVAAGTGRVQTIALSGADADHLTALIEHAASANGSVALSDTIWAVADHWSDVLNTFSATGDADAALGRP